MKNLFSWNGFKNMIARNYSADPGKMLLHTGAIGWVLSSTAQIFGIWINNKIPTEQKLFLIPQEAGDGFINIVAFYTLTSGVKALGTKLVKTAKIRPTDVAKILKDKGRILEKNGKRVADKVYAGDWDFDITKLPEYDILLKSSYEPFKNGAEVIAGLTGSILSSNLVTPVLRNKYASKRQKARLAIYDDMKSAQDKLKLPEPDKKPFPQFRSSQYLTPYHSSGNLKI